jgi:hypothetical protein
VTYENQQAWPRMRRSGKAEGDPRACFQAPGLLEESNRSLTGPLRRGTEPRVGVKGQRMPGGSDFGMDRVTPRGFDPMGTSDTRAPAQEASELISSRVRRYR